MAARKIAIIAQFFIIPRSQTSKWSVFFDKRKHSYRKMQDRIQQGRKTIREQIFRKQISYKQTCGLKAEFIRYKER